MNECDSKELYCPVFECVIYPAAKEAVVEKNLITRWRKAMEKIFLITR